MSEQEPFNHTNQPLQQLLNRDLELYELLKIPHSPERVESFKHELGCIATELYFRKRDGEY